MWMNNIHYVVKEVTVYTSAERITMERPIRMKIQVIREILPFWMFL